MFVPMRSFGSTIGLPFLSQTEDKQLSFRAGKNGIKRLYGSEVRATRDTILPYAKRDRRSATPTQVIPLTDYGYWSQVRGSDITSITPQVLLADLRHLSVSVLPAL
jgi:hypothetical protein